MDCLNVTEAIFRSFIPVDGMWVWESGYQGFQEPPLSDHTRHAETMPCFLRRRIVDLLDRCRLWVDAQIFVASESSAVASRVVSNIQ